MLGTLARLASEQGVETWLVTGDKDLMQLVSERVTLVDGIKDRRYRPEDVGRYGKPDISTLEKTGHLYFAATSVSLQNRNAG